MPCLCPGPELGLRSHSCDQQSRKHADERLREGLSFGVVGSWALFVVGKRLENAITVESLTSELGTDGGLPLSMGLLFLCLTLSGQ